MRYNVFIYGLVLDGRVVYVGQTKQKLRQRFSEHVCRTGKFSAIRASLSIIPLAMTTEEHANEVELEVWSAYRAIGMCGMNGPRFLYYYGRDRDYKSRTSVPQAQPRKHPTRAT